MQRIGRIAGGLCLIVLWAAGSIHADEPSQTGSGRLDDSFLANLVGDWHISRRIRDTTVHNTLKAEWVLQHTFVQLHMKDVAEPPQYEALVLIGYDSDGQRYVAHWGDSFGAQYSAVGYGKRVGDSIDFVFNYPDGPFHNRFSWDAEGHKWTFLMEAEGKDGKRTFFAEDTVRKDDPSLTSHIQAGNPSDEQASVLAAMNRYVTAISMKDFQTMAAMQTPEGMTYRARDAEGGAWDVVARPNSYWVDPSKDDASTHRERYWSPTVLIRGAIAVVWAPYEFWIDGKTSHCGVDVFDFVKVDGAWRVSNSMWTVEPKACAELRPVDSSTIRPAPSLAGPDVVAAEPAELQPFAFLVGEWMASGSGQPGAGSGSAVFSRALQGKVILRKSYAEYPPAGGKPGSRHDDLMVIYAGPGGGVRADYYDNGGHVIRYVVQSPAAGQAVFVSEAAGGEPRFRLSYRLEPDGAVKGEFEIAPPGAPEAFKSYLTWSSHKTSDGAK